MYHKHLENHIKEKILILGAMEMHVPLIKLAKDMGYYTITCDYYKDVPGHKVANKAYIESTTDIDAVLNIAEKEHINGIMTYNSDPAALTAAYVSEKLGLPGNSYKSVKIMSEKDLFRGFLKKNKLNAPNFIEINQGDNIKTIQQSLKKFHYPLIIKPVDSSGSKGISILKGPKIFDSLENIEKQLKRALTYSRCKRLIIEECIDSCGKQLHGDGFVSNGKIIFLCLGDHYFDEKLNNLVPYSTTFPSEHNNTTLEKSREEIQKFISNVGFENGGFNVELRLSKKDGKIYIIDIGARNGGNFVPKVIEIATDFNFMKAALDVAMGKQSLVDFKEPEWPIKVKKYVSYLILHSAKEGILKSITLNQKIKNCIIESHYYKEPGDEVHPFTAANSALGVLILQYKNKETMKSIVSNFEKLYSVELF